MSKYVIGLFAAMALLPLTTFAAVSFDGIGPVAFDNGNGWEASVDGDAGDAFKVRLIVDVTGDDDFNAVRWNRIGDFVTDPNTESCIQLDQEVTQSVSNYPVYFDMEFPQSVGSHDYVFLLYGVSGVGQDFNCSDSNELDSEVVTDQVITNIDGTNTSGNSGGGSGNTNSGSNAPAWLTALLAQLQAQANQAQANFNALLAALKPAAPVGAPAPAKVCPPSVSVVGVAGLQSWLITHGFAIPAIVPGGAAYGFYGTQTSAAYNAAMLACS